MTFLRLELPLAGFRPYEARDYQETLPLPPHSTVFGCLLSLIGIEREESGPYAGTCLGLAGRTGERSTILRKMRRDPANPGKGKPQFPSFRPEYQEILSDVVLWALVDQGSAEKSLAAEIVALLRQPERIARHGIISLGESCFMLDSIVECDAAPKGVTVLRPSPTGSFSFTVWVNFADRTRSRPARFEPVLGQLEPSDAVAVGP